MREVAVCPSKACDGPQRPIIGLQWQLHGLALSYTLTFCRSHLQDSTVVDVSWGSMQRDGWYGRTRHWPKAFPASAGRRTSFLNEKIENWRAINCAISARSIEFLIWHKGNRWKKLFLKKHFFCKIFLHFFTAFPFFSNMHSLIN